MSRRARSLEEKLIIIHALKDGSQSISDLESTYNINNVSIYDWVYKYERYGVDGLKESLTWKKYSKELKLQAVMDYISGKFSLREVSKKYEIRSESTLRKWIKKYNGHSDLKDTGKRRTISMTKGRRTRIEIVHEALCNGKNYQETAEKHQVSYQQVYQWVHKYEDNGWDALKDRRDRSKSDEELTPQEKLKLEIRRIEKTA